MILNIDKPAGVTSHDVVNQVRKITGESRVGHAGTLDPFATGVLVVAVGREDTKNLGPINENSEKEYEALLELGKTSSTGDPDGTIQETLDPEKVSAITRVQIEHVLQTYTGNIIQTTPAFSAVRVRGTRAYKLANKGVQIAMPPRHVTIHELELLEFKPPFARLRVVCSSGTYIRTLVEDIGKALGVGAYTKELKRTRVGEYKIEDSKTLIPTPLLLARVLF